MPEIDFEKALNPDQLAAVTHGGGPQLVVAGAGSGKTRVITYRVAWLVKEKGVDPGRIAAVTFTNKAAGEMRERVEELLGLYPLPTFVGTFHRFALRLLRAYGPRIGLERDFAIFDSDDQLRLIKEALKLEEIPADSFRPRAVLSAISGAKNRLLDPRRYEMEADDFFARRVARAYRRYQALLKKAGAVDFDDMIRLSVQLLETDRELRERLQRRYRHLLVDEFQDTNHAQLRLIHELAGEAGNLTAVGDEDQGIYRWRGAELENILRFEERFPGATLRKLERNYRSTQTILDASGALVSNNEKRRGKSLWTEAGEGSKILLYRAQDERDEARWIAGFLSALEGQVRRGGMAVLVRTNAQTRALEEEFLRRGMSYNLVGGVRFYERAEIKDVIAYLRVVRNPRDDFSLQRVVNQPPRGIGKTTRQALVRRAGELGISIWEALEKDELGELPERGKRALRRFYQLLRPLVEEAPDLPLPELLDRLLEATDYAALYDKPDADSRARLENLRELVSAVREFSETYAYDGEDDDPLTAFLDHVSLVADTDKLGARPGVSLMTLHSAKGLEFPVVVVAGLEEKLLPHFNALDQPDDIEEERRLLYVGMTRAERRLALTTCRRRRIAGTYQDQLESRFLAEVPERYLEIEESPQLFTGAPRPGRRTGAHAANVYSFFGQKPAAGDEAPAIEVEPAYEDTPAAGSSVRRGSRVRHPKLGTGRVLSLEGTGDEMRLTVYFDGRGRKKLLARYANLEVI